MQMKPPALAGLLGISTRRLGQLHEEGIAVKIDRGLYDAAATVQAMLAHASGKAAGASVELDLDRERARLAKEQADGQAMKNAIARGEYLPAEAVAQEWEGIVADVRSAMLAVPGRLRRRAGSALDAAAISLVDHEIREALEALAEPDNAQAARPHEGEAATEDETEPMD